MTTAFCEPGAAARMAFEGATCMIHTVTSREFSHNVSSAKNLAREGPVFITDRGEPAFV